MASPCSYEEIQSLSHELRSYRLDPCLSTTSANAIHSLDSVWSGYPASLSLLQTNLILSYLLVFVFVLSPAWFFCFYRSLSRQHLFSETSLYNSRWRRPYPRSGPPLSPCPSPCLLLSFSHVISNYPDSSLHL